MKKRLLFLAAFAATLFLLARCESDGVPTPDPTGGGDFPLCEGNKSDDPSCPVVLQGEDAVSNTDTNDSPDTTPPEPPTPAVDYTGKLCPDYGNCIILPSDIKVPDQWNRWKCGQPPDGGPPMAFQAEPTEWIPATCGLPEPTSE